MQFAVIEWHEKIPFLNTINTKVELFNDVLSAKEFMADLKEDTSVTFATLSITTSKGWKIEEQYDTN